MNDINLPRRRLLAGLAAGAAAMPTFAGQQPERAAGRNGEGPVGVAIAGLGAYAAFALERLAGARRARPAGILTGSPERAGELARRHGIPDDAIYGYDDYARLAADGRIDAVHICLPVGLHAPHALQALAAGKHVLVEKPLAGTLADARAMVEAATRAGRVLMPAYRAWFSPAVQEVIRRVRDGVHGPLVSVDAHKGFAMKLSDGNWRFDPALAGSGCLMDIGIYSVQLQRWVAGRLPRRVSAVTHSAPGDPRFRQVESDVTWLAEFDDGVLATGSASWRYRLQNRARIGLARAWLDLDPATPAIGERLRLGLDGPNRVEELMLPLRDQLPLMYDAFAAACLGEAPVPVPASEGLEDLRMIEAILHSAASGRPTEV